MSAMETITCIAFVSLIAYVLYSVIANRPSAAQVSAAREEFETLYSRLEVQLTMLEPVLDRVPADSPVAELYRKAMMYFEGSGKGPYRIVSIFERVRDMKEGLALIDQIRDSDDYKKLKK